MEFILLQLKDEILEYKEPSETSIFDEEKEIGIVELTDWKPAGRADHPLTLKFIKEILKND